MKKNVLFYLITILLYSCNRNEFSPNQKFDTSTPEEINAREITELSRKTPGPRIRIAVSGDTHTDYSDSRRFVDYINSRNDIDFVVLNGDLTNFGLLTEFEGIYDIYSSLKVPFITVIGNHDENAEGNFIFLQMFGKPNFTFDYGRIKFVCHDANSREHTFDGHTPNLDWLRVNLTKDDNTSYVIAFSHVPPIDADFDQKLRSSYESMMNTTPGMLASVHSHRHSADSVYRANGTGIPFIITNTILNKTFTIIDISDGQLNTYPVTF
jgi:Icc protein